MPSPVELDTQILQFVFLKTISEMPTREPPCLVPGTLAALARTVAAVICEAPDYREALDSFQALLTEALLREG